MTVRGTGLGFHFSISSRAEGVEAFFRQALRHLPVGEGWSPEGATHLVLDPLPGAALSVSIGGREVYTGEVTPALTQTMSVVNVGATGSAGRDPVLHCGVLSSRGRAVLLPGRPGAGKSTTATALLLRGFGYLSDEAAPVSADLRVTPYPKPVVVGRGSWSSVEAASEGQIILDGHDLDAWWVDPALLGCEIVAQPLPIGAVVAPLYRAGAALSVEELSRAEATTVMASNTFNMHDHGIEGVSRVAAAAHGIPLLRVSFGDVQQVCDLIEEVLG